MKRLPILLIIMLTFAVCCSAEKIYYKDGTVLDAAILYLNRGTVWIETTLGSMGIALEDIERIENNDGSIWKFDFKSLFNRSKELLGQSKYAEAIQVYDVLLASFPDDTYLHYLRGVLHHKINNLDLAVNDYLFLVDHQAADARIYNNLGVIYIKRKQHDDAFQCFNKAVAASPQAVEVHNNLAELLMEMKNYNGAILEYNRVVEIEPNNTVALYNLGVAYLFSGQDQKAEAQWRRALSLKPEDTEIKNSLEYVAQKNKAALR